jgi:hypothetical protein
MIGMGGMSGRLGGRRVVARGAGRSSEMGAWAMGRLGAGCRGSGGSRRCSAVRGSGGGAVRCGAVGAVRGSAGSAGQCGAVLCKRGVTLVVRFSLWQFPLRAAPSRDRAELARDGGAMSFADAPPRLHQIPKIHVKWPTVGS